MSSTRFEFGPLVAGLKDIRSAWGWFLGLGILLVLLGTVCVIGDVSATFATVMVLGWMLLLSGIFGLALSFRTHSWQGFLLALLSALLRGVSGYLLIRYPLAGAAGLTLLVASLLIVGGTFRAIGAGVLQFPKWGWAVLSGVVSLTLGVMLLAQMPVSSLWFVGFAIGVDLVFDGASLISFSTALHGATKVALEGIA